MMPFRDTLDDGAIWPWGRYWALETRNLSRLTPQVSLELVELADRMPSPGNILFLHDFHGCAAEESISRAFPLRQNHFVACAAASWTMDDEKPFQHEQRAWIDEVASRLTPFALPGGYINFLSPLQQNRVHEAYGNDVADLQALKRKYDPRDLLRHASGRLRQVETDFETGDSR